jgi:PAS domain S-box-containing protein
MSHLKEPPAADTLEGEILHLRTRIRDLVAFAALPATWTGREPAAAVADSFAGIIVSMLHVDALRESEERFRSMFAHAPVGVAVRSLEGGFLEVNPALCELTGYGEAELLATDFQSITHPDDLPAEVRAIERMIAGEIPGFVIESRYVKKDGAAAWAHKSGTLVADAAGQPKNVVVLVQDVTERRRSADALQESRRRLQALFENALDAILLLDDEGRYVDANPAATDLFGYDRAELLTMKAMPASPAGYQAQASAALPFPEHGKYSGEYRVLRKDGTIRDAEFRSVANILPGLHLAMVRDVTDRKRAAEELRQSRRRLEEAEEVAHIGYWEWDLASNDLVWSGELYRLFGVTPGEFRPSYERCLALIHPEDRGFIDDLSQRAAREGSDYAFDNRIVWPNGEVRFIHARGHAVRAADGSVTRMIGIAQDITDRKRDEHVRSALMKRLISIHEEERARISRELHDGTGQSLAALLVGLRRTEDARSLKEVRLAIARQRELVAQALHDLGRLARGLRPTVLDDLGLRAALERLISEQAWLFGFQVTLDAARLGRQRLPRPVETAFYRVAQEALANAARHADARLVRIKLERERESVRLTVTDDGCGFEVGRVLEGSGHLGLHGIRERAALVGGRAEIRSQPGEGTTVTVVAPLPATARPSRRAPDRPQRPGTRRRARSR